LYAIYTLCLVCENHHRSQNMWSRDQVNLLKIDDKKSILIYLKIVKIFIEPKIRRFNPLRRLRRIFRRKAQSPEPNEVKSCDNIVEPPSLDTSRSRSTSQLIDEPFTRRRYVQIMKFFLRLSRSRETFYWSFWINYIEAYTPLYWALATTVCSTLNNILVNPILNLLYPCHG